MDKQFADHFNFKIQFGHAPNLTFFQGFELPHLGFCHAAVCTNAPDEAS